MSVWTEIPVDERVIADIVEIGLQRQPYEACGVILPMGEVREIRNCVIEVGRFYMQGIDLADTIYEWVDEKLPEGVEELECIVWHTHPNAGSVGPSRDDLNARWDGGKFLVVTLPNGEAVRY